VFGPPGAGPHNHTTAGIAVALKEAARPAFKGTLRAPDRQERQRQALAGAGESLRGTGLRPRDRAAHGTTPILGGGGGGGGWGGGGGGGVLVAGLFLFCL